MTDTDCRKCKAPMPVFAPIRAGMFAGVSFKTTAYRCKRCGHWNDLKRRKPRASK